MNRIVALVTTILILTATLTTPAHATPVTNTITQHATNIAALFDAHNTERANRGLRPLLLAPGLSAQHPQTWANHLANDGDAQYGDETIYHSDLNTSQVSGAHRWGENVGNTFDLPIMDAMPAYMNSPGHRANVLNAEWTVIGIGVAVSPTTGWQYTATNFWAGAPAWMQTGPLYKTGGAWLAALAAGADTTTIPPLDVYTTPGLHSIGGREWDTRCEKYSSVVTRCRTDILTVTGWTFNNLTYLGAPRVAWTNNPLGHTGRWMSSGRQWKTDCDTPVTGRNGCRTYIWSGGQWRMNNMVRFS